MRVKVAQVMARDVPVAERDTPFKTVAQVLIAADLGAVPVVDADDRIIGVVTDADLLLKEEFKDQYPREGYRLPLRARLRRLFGRMGRGWREKSRGDTAAELMTSPAVTSARERRWCSPSVSWTSTASRTCPSSGRTAHSRE
ncbi:CBS domain-containing protein [Microbispora sp. ZYX-F-249]|uniref:CBS domain-containing protein n=1 Tax=Microbispora maris TaxID=3144104 RepID=A0ABV0AIR4_9ACTN